jgi:hypothetical protein
MSAEDRERLTDFVNRVYAWLDDCYLDQRTNRRDQSWPAFRPYRNLRNVGKEAWLELKQAQPSKHFRGSIAKLSDRKLVAHGLGGSQLRYKLAVINDLCARMRRVRVPGRFRPKLVDAIDTVLDSLISAVGAGTALKEIKDMLRAQR